VLQQLYERERQHHIQFAYKEQQRVILQKKAQEAYDAKVQAILQAIQNYQELSDDDILFLRLAGKITALAEYHEQRYITTRRTFHAVQSSAFWREDKKPLRALQVTEGVSDYDPKRMAMVLTTRGGAFRDLNQLSNAYMCAKNALELDPMSTHAQTLLFAIQANYHE
jgi:hypothetical protein